MYVKYIIGNKIITLLIAPMYDVDFLLLCVFRK